MAETINFEGLSKSLNDLQGFVDQRNQVAGKAASTAKSATQQNVFDVQSVETPVRAPVLPEQPSSAATDSLISDSLSFADTQQGQIEQLGEQQDVFQSEILKAFQDQGQIGEQREVLAEEQGLDLKREDAMKAANDIRAASKRHDDRIQDIRSNVTMSSARKNALINEIRRDQASEIANLRISQEVAQNSFASAQAIVDRKVDALTEQQRNRMQALQFFYGENKDMLTKAQDRQFQRQMKRESVALDRETSRLQQLEDSKLSMMTLAQSNNAPKSVIDSIAQASSAAEAVSLAGAYGKDPLQEAQLANIYSQINSRKADLDLKRQALARSQLEKAVKQAEEQRIEEEEKNAETEAALNNLRFVETIENHPGMSGAVGAGIGKTLRDIGNKLSFGQPFEIEGAMSGSAKAGFIASHEQLVNSLTLENLDLMSGVLSESDIKILSGAATRLKLSLSEKEYKKEVGIIKNTFDRSIKNNGVSPEQAQFYYNIPQDDIEEVNSIFGVTSDTSTPAFNPASFY